MFSTQWSKQREEAVETASSSSSSPMNDSTTDATSEMSTAAPDDPSVVVGLACRVPGASNPSQLWQNIQSQKDIQQKMPADRFNVDAFYHSDGTHKGTTNAKYGYFLDQDIRDFDAGFFNISGNEAEAMDPQQRLLLEVVYEALENAGITLDEISGSSTSVFAGSFTNDYNSMSVKDLEHYPKYLVTGTGNAILSNRISYFYNLHGSSVTIDTACSSSLVCFDLGNKSLQNGESEISIIVGSALHFDPNIYITMTDLGMLSTDGRCRAFDAAGSGYVRGEGIVAAILKKKSSAVRNGDNIRAIVRATLTNHDGKKNGITLPSSEAQEALIRKTYEVNGLDPADTACFEAHGTGTKAGDPRETRAIGAVFSKRRQEPLYVGSIKTNIGHLEGASGLAGIMKAILALENQVIPPNMLFRSPNPEINFKDWKIQVPTKSIPWNSTTGLRRASVNSFGYGGTNGHIVLEGYYPRERSMQSEDVLPHELSVMPRDRPYLLPLSSHSPKAGQLLIKELTKYLENYPDTTTLDFIYSRIIKRSMHQHRAFSIGKDIQSLVHDMTSNDQIANWTSSNEKVPRLGFVFTGQGGQWWGMGRQLLEMSPLFKQTMERCDEILAALPDCPDWSVVEELSRTKETTRLAETRFSQPICTALQLGILAIFEAWGIKPSAVVGHSSGEMAAAHAAGILSFRNAIIAAYYRGLYMSNGTDPVPGSMMAIGLSEQAALDELRDYRGRISVAAINSPSNVTVSGDLDAILELKELLTERKVFARQLQVAQAFHSHHMFPLAPPYQKALMTCDGFEPENPKIRMFSSVTARVADHEKMGPGYWCDNMTGAVRFCDALTGILLDENDEQNVDILVEIGPHPALKGPSRQTYQALKLDIPYLASLTRDIPDFEGLLATAGQLFTRGYPVDLLATNSDHFLNEAGEARKTLIAHKLPDLPSYTWDHSKYWAETRVIRDHRLRKHRHIILGAPIPGHIPNNPRWRNYLRQSELPWLADHRIEGKVIFPAAGYISIAMEAILRLESRPKDIKTIALKDIVIKSALIVSDKDTGTEMILEMKPSLTSAKNSSDEWFDFFIYSFDDEGRCSENCRGLIAVEGGAPSTIARMEPYSGFSKLQSLSDRRVPARKYYEHLNSLGLNYGDSFRLIDSSLDSGPGFAVTSVSWKPEVYGMPEGQVSMLHPALLDAAFHPIFLAIESTLGRPLDEPFVPTFLRSMKVSGLLMNNSSQEATFQVAANTRISGPRVATTDLRVDSGKDNEILIDIQGLEVTALGNDSGDDMDGRSLFFRTRWQPMFGKLEARNVEGIAQVVDVFAHQYPNAKILHLTSNPDDTIEALKLLGGKNGLRRRFGSLTPWSSTSSSEDMFSSLSEIWGSLVDLDVPKEGDYDLAIVSDSREAEVSSFVKDGGVIITESLDIDSTGLVQLFSTPQITAWRKRKVNDPVADKEVSIVLSSNPSSRTLAIASKIESSHNGSIVRQAITEPIQSLLSSEAIVILTSLDENLLFSNEPGNSSDFDAIRELLTEFTGEVVWVTEGATLESSRPEQNLIHGLARTVRTEVENLRLVMLDIEAGLSSERTAHHVLQVLKSPTREDELSIRHDTILIPRIEADDTLNSKLPNGVCREPTMQKLNQPDRSLALKIGKVGLLETLAFGDNEEIMDTPLADDELEIDVRASAINFRDIAASMGIIDDFRLGDECAGIVLRVGRDVDLAEFKPGDRVVASRPGQGAHQSVVRNVASWCYKLSAEMSFSIAAALPCILMTAYYSLVESARLQKGETMLIHAAAGGVGQMAIQVAQMLGANFIATVGSPAKRTLIIEKFGLRDDQIFNSRDDTFVQGVMAVTNGRGVDVALNSLAGKLLHATWKCIAPFGRFIEIGKRDIHENATITMEQFRKNVSFGSVDLVTMFERNKPLGSRILKECCALVHNGTIVPPYTITEFSYAEAQKGFRMLQMGKHTGKVVLVPGKDDIVPVMPQTYRNTPLFRSDKIYLVIGGLGGLGRTLAEFLVRRGARNLAMASRSGTSRPEAQETVDWLRARDVKVTLFNGDVTNYAFVHNCVRDLGDSLAGIFQAAMLLQDAPFEKMTYKQWQTGMAPKVQGTYNLHKATTEIGSKLDFFVCFSSISGILGGAAQANYSAANNYLDALMAHRRALGLAGSTMNCGMIVGIGAVSENAALQAFMERSGYDPVVEEELLYQIEEAVKGNTGPPISARGILLHQTISGVNLKRGDLPWASKPIFGNLYQNHDFKNSLAPGKDGGKKLTVLLQAAATVEERIPILTEAFIEKIAAILAVPPEAILPSNRLAAYGLDSIVAVEFRKWFSKSVGVELAVFDILGATSIHALVVKAANAVVQTSVAKSKEADGTSASKIPTDKDTQISSSNQSVPSTDIARLERPAEIPMSSFQRRLWFVHNLIEDRSTLNIAALTPILGKPDLSSFQLAIEEMVVRNDILRTAFFEGDDFAEQSIMPLSATNSSVQIKDFSKDTRPETSLRSFVEKLKKLQLQIEEGEVVKFALAKLEDEKYSFVVVCHHLSFDRGSAQSFLEQFTSIYDAIRSSIDLSTISPPRISYSDFTIWHNARLQSPSLQASVDFWKQKLAGSKGISSVLPFAKCSRPEGMDQARAQIPLLLPLKMLNRMKRLCTGAGVTPFHFLLAAFRSFLYRYTEESDITIHMIDGNRPHPDLQETIGFFVNMIPIRCSNDMETSFDRILEETKAQTLEALQHNKVPFDVIVDSVDAPKDPSVFPLGQVVVNYQMHGTLPTYTTKDFTMSSPESDDVPSACEIALEALEDPIEGLKLRLEYSTTLYAQNDAMRFMDNFLAFLTSTVKDHRQPIAEIEICGPLDLELQKTHFWETQTTEDWWHGQSVLEKIYCNAKKSPTAVAIKSSDGTSITYEDLLARAKTVSTVIQSLGVVPGSCIGLFCEPGIEAITGMLATLFSQCGYLALDPTFAPERLAYMVTDSNVDVVLVGEGLRDRGIDITKKTGISPKTIHISETYCSGTHQMEAPPVANPKDSFFTIYTSGSTGKPKGVVLSQSNTQQMLRSLDHDYEFKSTDQFLQHTSICFDLSVVQIFSALCAGATVCVATAAIRRDPQELGNFMAESSVTVTYFTPTQFALLLETCPGALRKCRDYRVAYFAGETLPVRVAKAFYELQTPATVYNTWSPSELVVQTTIHKVTPIDYENPKTNIPIGFPLANCRHYIVDSKLNPLPVGLVGEIAVGGAQVGQGYINRPKENAKAFLKNPFASPQDIKYGWQRLFRTGDKGRFLPNGELEFHGRIKGDKQIKLRGFRIDLGEVEQRLFIDAVDDKGQGLVDVHVTARPLTIDPSSQGLTDDRQLVAFLVPKKQLTTGEEIREFVHAVHAKIGGKLNSYMLPNGYEILPSLPVTIGGKVDRQNLLTRKLELVFPSSTGATSETQSGQEESVDGVLNEVIDIFRDVLSLGKERRIGASESFFELGGQSILVMRLQLKIKKAMKVLLSLPVLFKNATPEAIAALIGQKRTSTPAKAAEQSKAEGDEKQVDWEAETTLPTTGQYIVPYGAQRRERSEQTSILVTGAETFIGLHMVSTLLRSRSDTVVHFLGCEQSLSVEQLRARLQHYRLLDLSWDLLCLTSRLRPISGSLRERHFGLSESAFAELGKGIHAIYHMGGEISLLKSYTDLKAVNIDATLDVIELASLGRSLTEIHYLSTWSVLHLQSWSSTIFKTASRTIKTEEATAESFTPAPTTEKGYFKARWAAEILVTRAAQRGFPVTIYRPSAVTASTATKVPEPAGDIIRWMVGRMIASECIPDIANGTSAGFAIDFVPVDYLTSTILALCAHAAAPDIVPTRPAVYHIGNPTPLPLPKLPAVGFSNIKNAGAVPVEEFLGRVDKVLGLEKSVNDELRLSALRDYFTAGHTMFALDRTNTDRVLQVVGESVSCPPVDGQFLGAMFRAA